MTIVSHTITAAALAEGGIAPALDYRGSVTMNARILGAIRYRDRTVRALSPALDPKRVTIHPTMDPDRFLAAMLLNETEINAVEEHLLALREETYELGITRARVQRGFDLYALDAAVFSVQAARHDIHTEMGA